MHQIGLTKNSFRNKYLFDSTEIVMHKHLGYNDQLVFKYIFTGCVLQLRGSMNAFTVQL